jgi:hypothetical protein
MRERIFLLRRSGVPQAISNYMLPREKLVIAVRWHPGKFIGHMILLACCCAAASLLTAITSSGPLVLGVAWGACLVIFLWLVIRVAAWLESYLVVTDIRLIFITGLIARKATTVPLREISGVKARRRSLLSRTMGYGEFVATPARQGYRIPKMNYMPWPAQLLADISGVLDPQFAGDAED